MEKIHPMNAVTPTTETDWKESLTMLVDILNSSRHLHGITAIDHPKRNGVIIRLPNIGMEWLIEQSESSFLVKSPHSNKPNHDPYSYDSSDGIVAQFPDVKGVFEFLFGRFAVQYYLSLAHWIEYKQTTPVKEHIHPRHPRKRRFLRLRG